MLSGGMSEGRASDADGVVWISDEMSEERVSLNAGGVGVVSVRMSDVGGTDELSVWMSEGSASGVGGAGDVSEGVTIGRAIYAGEADELSG